MDTDNGNNSETDGDVLDEKNLVAIEKRKAAKDSHEILLEQLKQKNEIIEKLAVGLRKERDLLKVIFESTHTSLAYLDANFNFIEVNEAYLKNSGLSRNELLGKNYFDIVSKDNEALFKEVKESGKSVSFKAGPFTFKSKAGVTYWDWMLIPVKDELGNVFAFVLSLQDVTEFVKANETIEKSLKEKEILLQEVNHRVKNNLQMISSILHLQSMSAEGKSLEALNDSQSRIKSMGLAHQILYESKDFSSISSKAYLSELVNRLMKAYRRGSIFTELDIEDVPLKVNVAINCGLIVNELLVNALKHAFSSDSGKITVSLKKAGSNLELEIKDNGVGFSDLDMDNIASLGLRLVKSLVEQLEGKMEIKSDHGSTIKIVFPFEERLRSKS